jgi:pimeloyl-ACP methyl ester carboxylesterase
VRLPYAGSSYADWLADVLDALAIGSTVLVGSSAGAYFALKMAAFAPERVAALLLLNPAGLAPFRTVYYSLMCHPHAAYLAQALARAVVRSPAMARRLLEQGMYGHATDDNVDLALLLLHDYNRHHAPKPMPLNEIRRVTVPTELIVSEHELYTDPQQVQAVAQNTLPNLMRVQCVPMAGHDINKERPDLVNARIRELSAAFAAAAV